MLKISYFHTTTHTETFAHLCHITCVIDDTAQNHMPDIDQALLQFIDVINLVQNATKRAQLESTGKFHTTIAP